jgi:hypothetical protein
MLNITKKPTHLEAICTVHITRKFDVSPKAHPQPEVVKLAKDNVHLPYAEITVK